MINKVAEALASLNSGDIEGAKLILENLLIQDEPEQEHHNMEGK